MGRSLNKLESSDTKRPYLQTTDDKMEQIDPIVIRAAAYVKQANALNSFASSVLDDSSLAGTAARYLPGFGTGLYIHDAYNAVRNGKIWSGVGHGIQAGLSLIPGVGGGLSKILGGIGTAAKFGGGLLAGGATAAKGLNALSHVQGFGSMIPRIGAALSKGLGGGGILGHIPGVSKIPSLVGGAKTVGGAAAKIGDWGIGHAHSIENGLQGVTSHVAGLIPGARALGASKPIQWAAKNPGKTGILGGNTIPGVGLSPAFDRAQGGVETGKEMAKQTGEGFMSNLSKLRMSGFGNQDPRFVNPAASSVYP